MLPARENSLELKQKNVCFSQKSGLSSLININKENIMTQLVLIGVFNRELDLKKKSVKDFMEVYDVYEQGHFSELTVDLKDPGSVDGSNGGGGDDAATVELPLRISETGYTAQRWIKYPIKDFNPAKDEMFSEVVFPRVLRPQFCMVFNSRQEYSAHMIKHESFYSYYFAYVTVFLTTKSKGLSVT